MQEPIVEDEGGARAEVSATCNSHSVAEADGSLMLPEVLRPAPGEGISAGLVKASAYHIPFFSSKSLRGVAAPLRPR